MNWYRLKGTEPEQFIICHQFYKNEQFGGLLLKQWKMKLAEPENQFT